MWALLVMTAVPPHLTQVLYRALTYVHRINFVLGQCDHFCITVPCVYTSTATKLASCPGHCGRRGKHFPFPPQRPGYKATTKHTVVLVERLSPKYYEEDFG